MTRFWLVVTALVVAHPSAAHACSVCVGAMEKGRTAFAVSTAALSALPLLMIGGVVWWVKRSSDRATIAERVAAAAAHADAPAASSPLG